MKKLARHRTAIGAWCAFCLVAGVIVAWQGVGGDDGGGSHVVGDVTLSDAEFEYGLPPRQGDVEYHPDVVVVGGGPDSVEGVSADGTTWIVDEDAANLADLEIGKVMVLTTIATGRVVAIDPVDDGVAVRIGPVALTDVFHNADLSASMPIDLVAAPAHVIPSPIGGAAVDLSDAATTTSPAAPDEGSPPTTEGGLPAPTDGEAALTLPTMRLLAVPAGTAGTAGKAAPRLPLRQEPGDTDTTDGPPTTGGAPTTDPLDLPPETDTSSSSTSSSTTSTTIDPNAPQLSPTPVSNPQFEVTFGKWGVSVTREADSTTFYVYRRDEHANQTAVGPIRPEAASHGLKLGVSIELKGALSIVSTLKVVNGTMDGAIHVIGLQAISLSLGAGFGSQADGNIRGRLEVPFELNMPVGATGMNFQLAPKFYFETFFTSKNSSLNADTRYLVSGPLGVTFGAPGGAQTTVPTLTPQERLLGDHASLSLGVAGLVVGLEIRFAFGIGGLVAFAGAYFKVIIITTFTVGSALGVLAGGPACFKATLRIDYKSGLAAQAGADFLRHFSGLFDRLGIKKLEVETVALSGVLVPERIGAVPDSNFCRGI